MSSACNICEFSISQEVFKAAWAFTDAKRFGDEGYWVINLLKVSHPGTLVHVRPGTPGTVYACEEHAMSWYGMEVLFAQLKASGNCLPQ